MEQNVVASSDGTRILWTTVGAGAGTGVVVAPGSLSDGSDWFGVADRLRDGFAVHIVMRRGVAGTKDGLRYAIEREYEDIVAVLTATGSSRLVGHSYGGICALGAALIHGGLDRLAVFEPPLSIEEAVVPDDALSEIEAAAGRGDVERVVEIGLVRCVRLRERQVETLKRMPVWPRMVEQGEKWLVEMRALHDLKHGAERYAAISAPTLLLVGGTTPAGHHHRVAVEALSAVMPQARIAEIPGAAHQAHVDAPDALARELRRFLT